jgi:hypothetical protein
MTVKELIDELSYYDSNAIVRLDGTEEIIIGSYKDIDENGNTAIYLEVDKYKQYEN